MRPMAKQGGGCFAALLLFFGARRLGG